MSTADKKTVEVMPLKPGTPYDFEVRARNSVGAGDAINSDALAAAAKTPGNTGPTAVPVLRTSVGTHTGTVSPHQSNALITVSWAQLPATANGGEDGAVDAYELCYKKSTDSAWMRWDATLNAFGAPTLNGSDYSAVHGANGALLDPGTTYQYRARGLNDVATAGEAATCTHWDGDWSAMVSATTPGSRTGRADTASGGRRSRYQYRPCASRLGSRRQLDHDQVDSASHERRRRHHQLRGLCERHGRLNFDPRRGRSP